ncbi:anaerobic ribonucleoside-triphosphate reductase activating protein [Chitinimonas lacunae]|uniref:Anaerobic ribonucleoside-triphosphate reductase activating protein n=1 Tax=Chitinimonas lacunae TaxID=1963018 RepID=A0ABV8MLK0_9NEIS
MNAASSPNRARSEAAAPAPLLGPARPEQAAIAGLVPFSSLDWPGQLSAVLFIGGCPWRCHYCHNPHLQTRHARYDWEAVCDWLHSRRGLLDAVVFSGGEPLSESQLPQMVATVKAMGFKVGLHSAGIYPNRLAAALPALDWVGLDIKTRTEDYDQLTGRQRSHWPAAISLEMLLDANCEFECRTTWHPSWLAESALLDLARSLAERGVRHYAVQNQRSTPDQPPEAWLSETAQQSLHRWFERFDYRQ